MRQLTDRAWGLNGFALKWIALITMAIDHVGMMLFPAEILPRIIGRLAFPIYCFLLVEGAMHTSDKKRYLGRLLLFALISEVPFNLAVSGEVIFIPAQNVFFTLFLGLLAVFLMETRKKDIYAVAGSVVLMFVAELGGLDYGGGGVLLIFLFYVFYDRTVIKCISVAAVNVLCYGGLQAYAILSLAPILCYNGKRGPGMKYLFYLFYPVHLLVLYLLKVWMLQGVL